MKIGQLNERIQFCEDVSERVNGLPSKKVTKVYYECWSAVQEMRTSDTLTQLTTQSKVIIAFVIRNPRDEYTINNHHYVRYRDQVYPIKYNQPDMRTGGDFLKVFCEVTL